MAIFTTPATGRAYAAANGIISDPLFGNRAQLGRRRAAFAPASPPDQGASGCRALGFGPACHPGRIPTALGARIAAAAWLRFRADGKLENPIVFRLTLAAQAARASPSPSASDLRLDRDDAAPGDLARRRMAPGGGGHSSGQGGRGGQRGYLPGVGPGVLHHRHGALPSCEITPACGCPNNEDRR